MAPLEDPEDPVRGHVGPEARVRVRREDARDGAGGAFGVAAHLALAELHVPQDLPFRVADLGPDVPTDRILGILERRHRATFTRASDVKGPGAPAEGADEAEVFPWSLLREVVTARRERLIFDTGVIDKMIAALEAVVEVADPLAPAAQDAAAAAARGGAAEVAALLEAQDRLLRGLDAALTAMAEWQSLSELTLFLRRVIEEQEALDRDIRDMKKGPR